MTTDLRPLPPEEAIAYFRSKGLATSYAWEDVWQEEHAKAFTVAKAMQREVLEDIRAALDRAIADGTTLETFRQELTPLLQARGWWGRQEMTDPLTGGTREVQLGSPRRLRTIFDVNMRSAYQAGRWERGERVADAMPYLRYVAVGGKDGDGRTRLQHRTWHGTILRRDHPWWDTHYGPCGWHCRCTATSLSARTIARRGWTITEEPVRFPDKAYTNRRTGEVTRIEAGIDPGFNFNVGKAYLDGSTPRPIPDAPDPAGAETTSINAARDNRPGELLPIGVSAEDAIAAFLDVLAAPIGRITTDPTGFGLVVGPALMRRLDGRPPSMPAGRLRSLGLIARAILEPAEIRECWREADDGRRQLVRRYIAGYQTPDGLIDVMAEFGSDGWRCRSSAEPDFHVVAILAPRVVWRRESV